MLPGFHSNEKITGVPLNLPDKFGDLLVVSPFLDADGKSMLANLASRTRNDARRTLISRGDTLDKVGRWVFRLIVTSDSGIVTTQSGIVTSDSDDGDHPGMAGWSTTQSGLYVVSILTRPNPVAGEVRGRRQSLTWEAAVRRLEVRRDSPFKTIRCACASRRSSMASAMAGSPIQACQ